MGEGDAGLGEGANEQEFVRVRGPRTRSVLQVIGAALAIFLFIALAVALTGDASTAMAGFLLGGLVVILLVEVLLLEPVYARLFHRVPRSLPVTPGEDNYVVGCPGCGTVFTVLEEELERGSFACHNCGRAGYVKDTHLNHSAIQEERCPTCGNTYLEYMEQSECPVCHTFNPQ